MDSLYDIVPREIAQQLDITTISRLKKRKIGVMQYALLTGGRRWSLATLKGKARDYAGRYREARDNAFWDLGKIMGPIAPTIQTVGRGRRLVIRWPTIYPGLSGMVQS